MKRLFDILSSGIGLILISPILLIAAVWIRWDSKGPIFYKQTRVGLYGKDFKIFKFRSMYVNSDKSSQITIGGHDPRITRCGYYLRKYKIDELPQLINVLKGDMSLVGPRPEVRQYIDLLTPEQMHVLDVRPGITCEASIKYRNENELLGAQPDPDRYYEEVILPDKVQLGLHYVDHHSWLGDMQLILQTINILPYE